MTKRETRAWARVHFLENKVMSAVVNDLEEMCKGPFNEVGRLVALETSVQNTAADTAFRQKVLQVIDMDNPLADYVTDTDYLPCDCGSGKAQVKCCGKKRARKTCKKKR